MVVIAFLSGCGTKAPSTSNPAGPAQSVQPSSANPESSGSTPGSSSSTDKTLPSGSMISASQLAAGMKANDAWQIIDVREPNEFASGHIEKAMNMPLGNITSHLNEISKDKEVILVCLNGSRSFTAWQILTQKGYTPNNVKVLVGGMEQWKNLGSGEVTESIGGC